MASNTQGLKQAVHHNHLRPLDRYLAEQLLQLCTQTDKDSALNIGLAIALLSRATGDGHVCLELGEWAGRPIFFEQESQRPMFTLPQLAIWRQALLHSGIVSQASEQAPATQPLVLDAEDRLYLARYYHFEADIEAQIKQRTHSSVALSDIATLKQSLQRYFPDTQIKPDQQKLAAALAMLQAFCVISGGPGTGKTTTVTRILALYLQHSHETRIALVAPTGKAAARLTESIRAAKQKLTGVEATQAQEIPEQATTVHRLLRPIRNSSQFRHHADNPLHLDLLIVDEASMLDVPLMARLMNALPASCRIILLGDRDQLASVEAGSVFSDLCNRGASFAYSAALTETMAQLDIALPASPANPHQAMADSVAVLSYSHRFGSDSGIGQLARAINQADTTAALKVCDEYDDASLSELLPEQLAAKLYQRSLAGFSLYLKASTAPQALQDFSRYRILCALREGAYGVTEINAQIEKALHAAGLIDTSERYYHGRPLMIKSNDYTLQLYNGDIGICLRDPEADNRIRVFFEDAEGTLRSILPSRLPEHETAYAMTVHKSQGSEFDCCLLVLPQRDAAVLTRELVYTGVTRAKRSIEIWCGDVGTFRSAVERGVERHSGLYFGLWG